MMKRGGCMRNSVRLFCLVFIGVLTVSPLAVAFYTDAQTTAVLPPELITWQRFIPIIVIAITVAISTSATLFVPLYLRNWPLELKVMLTAVFTLFTTLIYWLALILGFLTVASLTAVLPTWLYTIGWLTTAFILASILFWTDYLYSNQLSVMSDSFKRGI